ncbi:uncharacterized protein LOC122132867 isoform X3 [Clupea harengus]|uniref:Uncharacterized protein LOC122132867 isoform X3 n=1 Tax=Clupea harengus TaxID=7950 RepID=A0A8M1KLY4_CLUHA|nr:uncharacterized protein LOC122132867 isoform X3 [Clupea harengus]
MSVILSNKSDDEIRWMLEDYGIKHGPVVGSTRQLYERKLREAMAIEKKARLRPRPPSERTFYREEEEITYVHRQPRFRDEDFHERAQATHRNMTQSAPAASRWGTAPPAPEEKSSSRRIPVWVQFLVFLLFIALLFFIFTNMEPAESVPFKRIN